MSFTLTSYEEEERAVLPVKYQVRLSKIRREGRSVFVVKTECRVSTAPCFMERMLCGSVRTRNSWVGRSSAYTHGRGSQ